MSTNTTELDLHLLEQAKIPHAYFAKYADVSRVSVAQWVSAAKKGEARPVRPVYFRHIKTLLAQVQQLIDARIVPPRKPFGSYAEFAAIMEQSKSAN